ncbi:MAG: hypothetical protein V4787_09775 [Pseudomonadota bacterium]
MRHYKLLVLANAKDGEEGEFHRWYDQVHVPEMFAVPELLGIERFELAPAQRTPGPHPHRFLAVYDFATDDLQATLQGWAAKSAAMTKPSAVDPDSRVVLVMQPISPRVTRRDLPAIPGQTS